jgi:hypothetical protein
MPGNKQSQLPEYRGYLQIELDENDRTQILSATEKMTAVWKSVATAVMSRFKFTVNLDGYR